MTQPPPPDATTLAQLLRAARGGDEAAWGAIVERLTGFVYAVARVHRLPRAAAADVVQTTWLRLVEHLDDIRDPEALKGWLATTARRECLRELRRQGRLELTDDADSFESVDDHPVDGRLLVGERDAALRRAFGRLGERCQKLLRLLASQDEPSYRDISAALGIAIGSIGPTRQRCLSQLRQLLAGDNGSA